MRFIADEHISPEVIAFLQSRGHEVFRSIDVLGLQAPDPDIANWASAEQAIVLTSDRWFRDAISRRPGQKRVRFPGAGRILFSGDMTKREMIERLTLHIERVEREYRDAQGGSDSRLIVEITKIRFHIEI